MGGRGASIGKKSTLADFKRKKEDLDKQINLVGNKMAELAKNNNAWEMPRSYYALQRKYHKLREKRVKVQHEIYKRSPKQEYHTTVKETDIWGGVSKREITSSTYERAVKRTMRQLANHHVY